MNNTQQAGETANPFKEWLGTKDGKSCMMPASFLQPRDMQYLENRLWWAYTAGMGKQLQDIQSPTPAPDAVEGRAMHAAIEDARTYTTANTYDFRRGYLAGHAEGAKGSGELLKLLEHEVKMRAMDHLTTNEKHKQHVADVTWDLYKTAHNL